MRQESVGKKSEGIVCRIERGKGWSYEGFSGLGLEEGRGVGRRY